MQPNGHSVTHCHPQRCHQLPSPAARCSCKMQTRSGLQRAAATSAQPGCAAGSGEGRAVTSTKLLISATIKIPQRWGNKDPCFPSTNTREGSVLPARVGPLGFASFPRSRRLDCRLRGRCQTPTPSRTRGFDHSSRWPRACSSVPGEPGATCGGERLVAAAEPFPARLHARPDPGRHLQPRTLGGQRWAPGWRGQEKRRLCEPEPRAAGQQRESGRRERRRRPSRRGTSWLRQANNRYGSATRVYTFKAAFGGKTQNRQQRLWEGILNAAEMKGIAQEKT